MTTALSGLRELPAGSLKVDIEGQGLFNQGWADEIAANWRDEAYGVLTVSYRDGAYWVIDGQHRLAAARKLGVETLRCFVLVNKSTQEEAQDWLTANVARRTKNGWDRFHQRVRSGDGLAIAVKEICAGRGIRIVNGTAPLGATRSVGTLFAIAGLSTRTLERTLDTVLAAWSQDRVPAGSTNRSALGSYILAAVGDFLWVYRGHPQMSKERLVGSLSRHDALAVEQAIKGNGRLGVRNHRVSRDVILSIYNSGLKTSKLPEATQGDLKRLALGQNPWMAPA
jgi:hypothetical protein